MARLPERRRLALFLSLAIVSAAPAAERDLLAGSNWGVIEIGGATPAAGSAPNLAFAANGRVSGDASCNRFTGGYRQDGVRLSFSQMATTRRACAPPLMTQENRMLAVLAGVTTFRREEGRLVLLGTAGRLVLSRQGDAPAGPQAVRYSCDNGETIALAMVGERVRLTDWRGRTVMLDQRPAGSGVWYEGGGHVIRGKGPDLTWTFGARPPRRCREIGAADEPRSPQGD